MAIRLTPTVKWIMIACLAGFLVQQTVDQFMGGNLISWLGLVPSQFMIHQRFWQLFTYPFLHADVTHLLMNMIMLLFFGSELESVWGRSFFLKFYFLCAVTSGVVYLLLQAFVWGGEGLGTPMVGASGAIFGLLMAYGLIFGERTMLLMMLIPMKAKYITWIFAGVQLMTVVFSGRNGLSGAAHLTGMITGFVFLWVRAALAVMKKKNPGKGFGGLNLPKFGKKKSASQAKGHLRLVIDNDSAKKEGYPTVKVEADDDDSDPKTWH
ncbi:MAG: rhomboid family intramembrane serine protease [Bdellovibrionales bacterium]|nr:rhomboid family intramembrane serine protease [Bdellovibrionales bacterium]